MCRPASWRDRRLWAIKGVRSMRRWPAVATTAILTTCRDRSWTPMIELRAVTCRYAGHGPGGAAQQVRFASAGSALA